MRSLLVLSVVLALASPVGAEHCTGPQQSEHELTTCVAGMFPCYYVDNDACSPECGPGLNVWIYEESNGWPGLQRGDEVDDDTCHGMIEPDTVIF